MAVMHRVHGKDSLGAKMGLISRGEVDAEALFCRTTVVAGHGLFP